MNIFKRSLLGIIRQPIKSFILLISIAILGTFIAISVCIKQGLLTTKEAISSKMKITASIHLREENYVNLTSSQLMSLQYLDNNIINRIVELPQVKGFEITKSMKFATSQYSSSVTGTGTGRSVNITAYSAKNGHLLDYIDGNISIVNGRWLVPDDENSSINPVVISDLFAKENDLAIGSNILFDISVVDIGKVKSNSGQIDPMTKVGDASFTVIGTFKISDKYMLMPGGSLTSITNYSNLNVYTTQYSLDSIINYTLIKASNVQSEISNYYSVLPSFVLWLNNRESADSFKDAVNIIGLPNNYVVDVSTESYDKTLYPIKNINWIANILIFGSSAITVVLMSLCINLIIKSRKEEIGILISLGEKKIKVIIQILIELLILTIIGVSISAFIGTFLSGNISEEMVKNEVKTLIENRKIDDYNFDFTALHSMSERIKITLGLETYFWIYFIGIFTTTISSIIPIIFILCKNPKRIME